MSVKEQLASLIDADGWDAKRMGQVLAATLNGVRWLFATNGHALAMVVCNEEAPDGPFVNSLLAESKEALGVVSASVLKGWLGKAPEAICPGCAGLGKCDRCKVGPCVECQGKGTVPVVKPPSRNGMVGGRVIQSEPYGPCAQRSRRVRWGRSATGSPRPRLRVA